MLPTFPPSAGRVRLSCLWVPLSGLLLLILLAVGVGFMLPPEHEGSFSVTVPEPRQAVWDAVLDSARYPITAGSTRSVERLQDEGGLPVWREDLEQTSFIVKTVHRQEPSRLVREIQGTNTPLDARFTVELLQVSGGTRITAIQRVAVNGVAWEVPFSRLIHFFGGAEKWARDYLQFLERGLAGT